MPRSSSLNTLVAEDRADEAAALRKVLGRDGHCVRVAGNAEAALRAVLADPPDVLFLDIDSPILDDYKVAAAARDVTWMRRPLVVTLTGHERDDYRQRATAAAGDLYLTKPVDPNTLRAILGRLTLARR
jgi:CheY-like chemotaxis protein